MFPFKDFVYARFAVAARRWTLLTLLVGACWLIVCVRCCNRDPQPTQTAKPVVAGAPGNACEARLAACEQTLNLPCVNPSRAACEAMNFPRGTAPAKPIEKWLATGDPSAFAAGSAAPSTTPNAPPAMRPVDDLDALLGTWVDHEHGDMVAVGIPGGMRVVFKKNPRGKKTPYGVTFWAPRLGHDGGDAVSGGCGFYRDRHEPSGWRAAYCTGFGKGESIATHLKLETDGRRLRFDLDNWLLATLVRQ